MSNGRRSWDDIDDKRAAIIAVIKHVNSQPPEVGQKCVAEDAFVRSLFEDPQIGNIDVPNGVKTLFMPEGERKKEAKGSVAIELPTRELGKPSDDELLHYVLCCYNVWPPAPNS